MKIDRILVFFAGIGFIMAREISRDFERIDDNSDNTLIENRKHKPYHDLFLFERKSGFSTVYVNPLRDIAFMGGLQGLFTFIVIKIKIVLAIVTIIGSVALALKLFSIYKYTGYSYKNIYPPVGPPPYEYSSYHSPSGHHDNEFYSNDWTPEHYARSSSKFPNESVNMTEIVYSFMNIDKKDCQSRLICELKIILSTSPFYHYLTRISDDITRQKSSGTNNHAEDCEKYYTKCRDTTRSAIRGRKRHATKY